MSRKIALIVSSLLATACAAPSTRPPALDARELLSGEALFGDEPRHAVMPPGQVVALDEEMRAFVDEHLPSSGDTGRRLRQLLGAMRDRGLFDLYYAADRTRTPRETFHDERGNCLSFTMLFVTLAREAGLDVQYQMVEVPPTWNGNDELAILTQHINAVVKSGGRPIYTVDFNETRYRADYVTREVDDTYALALFYSNRGVEAMLAGDHEASLRNLALAIEIYPDLAGPWSNLGVLYSRHGLYDHAEAAYLHALRRDRRDNSSLVNLANLYRITGQTALADEYAERVRRHRRRNPYYHYSLARGAYEEGRPQEALSALDAAIRLKKDEHQFHFLKALAHLESGDADAALASFDQARTHAEQAEVRQRYESRIAELSSAP